MVNLAEIRLQNGFNTTEFFEGNVSIVQLAGIDLRRDNRLDELVEGLRRGIFQCP